MKKSHYHFPDKLPKVEDVNRILVFKVFLFFWNLGWIAMAVSVLVAIWTPLAIALKLFATGACLWLISNFIMNLFKNLLAQHEEYWKKIKTQYDSLEESEREKFAAEMNELFNGVINGK